MSKERFENAIQGNRRTFGVKSLVLVLACVLLFGGAIGGTLAWLMDASEPVVNTFTESDIIISLSETLPTDNTAAMVPGLAISKNPVVTVDGSSEDCWLFVKITESSSPKLDDYIAYAIATEGWTEVSKSETETIIGRRVKKSDAIKEFSILVAGEYTDDMGTPAVATDDYIISWGANEVCVKPSVTKAMMEAISTQKPTLSFKAYAVQLYKAVDTEFTIQEAWARAEALD